MGQYNGYKNKGIIWTRPYWGQTRLQKLTNYHSWSKRLMAAFSLTASGVSPGTGASVRTITSNQAHVAGQAITGGGYISDPNDSTKTDVFGISVSTGTASGIAAVVFEGDVVVTDTLTPQRQIIAAPSGQLQYDSDLLSGDAYIIVGYTKDANTIYVYPKDTGVTKA
jgi:hypothetical protein